MVWRSACFGLKLATIEVGERLTAGLMMKKPLRNLDVRVKGGAAC